MAEAFSSPRKGTLVSITDDLGGFERASWIVSAYMLGYVEISRIVIIFSKLSDVLGRQSMLFLSVTMFVVFSAGCGASNTVTQLIICRAFQGIGGGGCFGIGTIISLELVPEKRYAALTALISAVYALSMIAGPILGGAISKDTSWRWIFLLNVPASVPCIIIVLFCFPRGFPYHGDEDFANRSFATLVSRKNLARIDLFGVASLLLATLALVTAVEEAGLSFGRRSAFVIALLTLSGILWIVFLLWERYITEKSKTDSLEPVFPWRFAKSRVWMGMLINAIFLGAAWTGAIFQLPQRFQVLNAVSAVEVGIRLLPFTAPCPVGSIFTAVLAKKGVPPIYMVIAASALQVAGFALLGSVPRSHDNTVSASLYGYQAMFGFGLGTNISLLTLMTPFCVETKDKAVAMGAITQFRVMGEAIGVSIVNTAMHSYLRSELAPILTSTELAAILSSAGAIRSMTPFKQEGSLNAMAEGYQLQFRILSGLAGMQIFGSIMMWQKKQITI
ncbi:MFS multidrug transporter-like protein [Amniculicola lignicola CBS 123094]|uniref:MFS multidrug transporter-like protein n=1 Tax=Amniculicola lignicola CBS 123094 TaxID=1392246 RepID=A0A6A5VXW4_9PLEO|nr:MFS multidrug transporter-like protein [Amniculicola lignicola CBS 123094]